MTENSPRILCLVAADELAEAVVATARRIADAGGYQVHHLHAADVPARTVPVYAGTAPGASPGYSREWMMRRAHGAGEALLQRLGLDEAAEIVDGDPVTEALTMADELEPELIVVGGGRGAVTSAILGSVSRELATKGRWPLIVVSGPAATTDGPVVCGIADPAEDARRVAGAAAGLARRLGQPLVLAHVREAARGAAHAPGGGFPAAPGGVLPPADGTTGADGPASLLAEVASSLDRALDTRGVVLDGSPASALTDLADEVEAAVVAVGNRGLTGLRAAVARSVSMQAVRRAGRPVLVVPAGADEATGD